MPDPRHDLIILGGGLAGGLAALALRSARPDLKLALVEPGAAIGGNHLWSFFDSDVAPADAALVEPLISHRWPGYDVRFPAHRRRIDQPYRTIESERLDAAVRGAMPAHAIIRANAVDASPIAVTLDDGSTHLADAVLDARGLSAPPTGLACGWQKFCGQTLSIPAGHGLDRPIVMDAKVDQAGGYRFVYCLPFSPTEVFVEDTYYSDMPDLDQDKLAARIAAYAAAQGWCIDTMEREETGVLPVVMDGDFDSFWPAADRIARAGVRAGLFHPLTSYSLPDAVRFASWLARDAPLDPRLGAETRDRAADHWRRGKFDRLLARMLFKAADPPERYRVLERFYRLPAPLIARFYAGRSTLADRARILAGRPPVAVGRAIGAMMEKM
ncbi:MAG: lycopene beta-cyclase CrtY [Pseudomonadota bacterium]|nr:lycopene beta-cyclase CrtY [Pseudomonadota bacterium]